MLFETGSIRRQLFNTGERPGQFYGYGALLRPVVLLVRDNVELVISKSEYNASFKEIES